MSLIDEELDFEPEDTEAEPYIKQIQPKLEPLSLVFPPINVKPDILVILDSSDDESAVTVDSPTGTTNSWTTNQCFLDRDTNSQYQCPNNNGENVMDSEDEETYNSDNESEFVFPIRTIINNQPLPNSEKFENEMPVNSNHNPPVIRRLFVREKRPWTHEIYVKNTKITSSHEMFSHFPLDNCDPPEVPFKIPRLQPKPAAPPSDSISLYCQSELPIPMEIDKIEPPSYGTQTESIFESVLEFEPHPSPPPIDPKTANIQQWLENTSRAIRIDLASVPEVFHKLCYYHFFYKGCKYLTNGCKRSHDLQAILGTRLFNVNKQNLWEAYTWTARVPTFRCEAISYFIKAFAKWNMKKELCDIITDSFDNDLLNEKEITALVIQQIMFYERIPLPNCIKFILITIAVGKYPSLCDILLEIVAEYKNYDGDWDCIALMAYGYEGEFSIMPIMKIISNCTACLPAGRNLLYYIGELLEKKLINGQELPLDLLSALKNAIRNYNPTVNNNVPKITRVIHNVPRDSERLNDLESDSVSVITHRDIVLRTNTEVQDLERIHQFGNPSYHPMFELNHSLHNLYPLRTNPTDLVEMQDIDVRLLNDVIRNCDGKEFLDMIKRYKDPCSVKSFVCMTIADLKASNMVIFASYMKLLKSTREHYPNFMSDSSHKAIFEIITMNLLCELEAKLMYKEAALLLQQFYDWDSLVSSKLLIKKKTRSLMGRYIYLCKLLLKTHEYKSGFTILSHSNLKFLEHPSHWPHSHTPSDLLRRNRVLSDFFKEGFHYDIEVINSLFKIAFTNDQFYGYNVEPHLSPMFTHLINEKVIPSLKVLYKDFDLYYERIKPDLLRAFTITMIDELPDEEKYILFEKCAKRGIYKVYNGNENVIDIPVDYCDIEILVLFGYFLNKLNSSISREITVKVVLSNKSYDDSLNVLKDCKRSLDQVKQAACAILKTNFKMTIKPMESFQYFFKFHQTHRLSHCWTAN